jgi:hypothetical protein
MSDLKWLTLGFIQNFVQSVSGDKCIASVEQKSLLSMSEDILQAIHIASHDDEVEVIHEKLHSMISRLCAYRLSAQLRQRTTT